MNEDDIVVLEGLEPIRKRPGMYLGLGLAATDQEFTQAWCQELLLNAIGGSKQYPGPFSWETTNWLNVVLDVNVPVIEVFFTCAVPRLNTPTWKGTANLAKVICTALHCGSYPTPPSHAYLDLSIVNALSEQMVLTQFITTAESNWNYQCVYRKGVLVEEKEVPNPIRCPHNTSHGLLIQARPDSSIFKTSYPGTPAHQTAPVPPGTQQHPTPLLPQLPPPHALNLGQLWPPQSHSHLTPLTPDAGIPGQGLWWGLVASSSLINPCAEKYLPRRVPFNSPGTFPIRCQTNERIFPQGNNFLSGYSGWD